MTLHENKKLFKEAILATAQWKNIPEVYIEKDYWVTLALYKIFLSDAGKYTIFKGGTALSKCHKLIDRFSEDVDLVVVKEKDDTGNKLKNKLKVITDAVETIMPAIQLDGVTNKLGMIRKTAHQYDRMEVDGAYGQIREHVIVEATWLGTFEPNENSTVCSYITEMMFATKQNAIIEEYKMKEFTVNVIRKERTFCEKIMSLVRFSLTAEPYVDLANKIRHIYDLHMMLKNETIRTFMESDAFDAMLNKVGADDRQSFKNNNEWLSVHPATAIIFNDPVNTWEVIKRPYKTTFKNLVTGELPLEQALIETLIQIGQRIKKIKWA